MKYSLPYCLMLSAILIGLSPSTHGEDTPLHSGSEDIVWSSEFSRNGLKGWEPFGEAGDAKQLLSSTCALALADANDPPRKVLQTTFDDSSPTDWFHKGAKVTFPEPISWDDFDYVSCRYLKDESIISIGYYLRDEDGNWWESFQSRDLVTGQWGSSVVKKSSFKLGELSYRKNSGPAPQKTAKLRELFVYFGSISANSTPHRP